MSLNVNNNVGYTVVDGGNIHIENGIVSGFSSSDRLKLTPALVFATNDNIEYNFVFTTGQSIGTEWLFGYLTGSLWSGIYITSTKVNVPFTRYNDTNYYCSVDYSLQTSTTYRINVKRINGTVTSALYDSSNTLLASNTNNIPYEVSSANNTIGTNPSYSYGGAFTGSIDLNKTYIKINGITWFNGKETASTTVNDIKLNRNVGYTVVGSPTINNGVVSGCGSDNYLKLNSLFPDINNSDMDIFITLKSAGIGAGKGYRNVLSEVSGIRIALTSSSTPTFTVYTKKSGESTSTARNIYNYSAQVDSNNNFYLHFTKNGNVLSIQGANNDGVFKSASKYTLEEGEEIGLTSVYPEIMHMSTWSSIENSAIDLNNTYIKINGITWFNGKETASTTVNDVYLNRNVGYTIVGSPTISDGIVSGFSSDDYILLPSVATKSISEFIIKIKLNSSALGQNVYTNFLRGPSSFQGFTYCGDNYFAYTGFNISGLGDLYINHNLQPDTDYWLRYTNDGTNCTAWWSENGVNYTAGYIKESSLITDNNSGTIRVGSRVDRLAFPGSIDLNNTYIKVNGITFFNGKDVNFQNKNNYRIENGNLVWANPNLWLESSGTQYIDTGYTPIQYDEIKTDIMFTSSTASAVRTVFSAGTGNYQFTFAPYDGKTYFKYFATGNASLINYQPNMNTWYSLNVDGNGVCSFAGYTITSNYASALDGDNTTMYLFMRRNNTFPFIGKLKSFIIKNKGIIKKHFVPVPKGLVIGNYTVPSNGMWDIVSQTFFANQGTGNFTFGKDGTAAIWTRGA